MPVISMFYGIIVSLYFLDNKQHKNRTSMRSTRNMRQLFR